MSQEVKTVTVPYGDFVDGVIAQADLDCLRAIVANEKYYVETEGAVKRILGLSAEDEECLKDSQELQ